MVEALREDARSMCRDLGIEAKTTFAGVVADLGACFSRFDVFCFPSRYEGMPNALLEAAAAGLPIVASDIPEIRSVAAPSWQLCPVDDVGAFSAALEKVAGQIDHYRVLAESDAEMIRERYGMKRCLDDYLAFTGIGR